MVTMTVTPTALTMTSTTTAITFNIASVLPSGTIALVTAPAHYNSTGTSGQIAVDDDYFYVCVSTDRWGKCPLIKNF